MLGSAAGTTLRGIVISRNDTFLSKYFYKNLRKKVIFTDKIRQKKTGSTKGIQSFLEAMLSLTASARFFSKLSHIITLSLVASKNIKINC